MSYTIVPSAVMPVEGLGKMFSTELVTPFGNQTFGVNVPYEQWTQEAVQYATGQLQPLASQAINYAVDELKPKIPGLLEPALKQAGAYVTETLWPTMQPKIRKEADRAINAATRNGSIIAAALMVTIIGSAIWIRSGKKAT